MAMRNESRGMIGQILSFIQKYADKDTLTPQWHSFSLLYECSNKLSFNHSQCFMDPIKKFFILTMSCDNGQSNRRTMALSQRQGHLR
jgi:hypothetical protein